MTKNSDHLTSAIAEERARLANNARVVARELITPVTVCMRAELVISPLSVADVLAREEKRRLRRERAL